MSERQNAKQSIVETASKLFVTQGYHATGLSQIIKESECPKGSVYYYFPKGKEELAIASIECTKQVVLAKWNDCFNKYDNPAEAIAMFIKELAVDVAKNGYEGYVPFSFWIAAETSSVSDKLREASQSVFAAWQNVISSRLHMTGIGQAKSNELGTVIVSLLEGALLLAITNRDTTPLLSASKCVPYLITKCPSL
ncbi:TetR/AcrR family transcriptional regulator [Paenibacillus harenae]|uniref:TetR/AcrR family transcriptional repressor of lmrAB and yxaGH operons n=1 Tax=Paenibacillus harenae TaxID=306543 RepID=A0ABT9TX28_PAEHA|nr:TetR/AcrR family transcriptional regulator [Paenibacillus harenae]MDQ0111928.1 TetR/AcrR family transcriptional repressor of lmrAB and yxaGH operons [Paenibacillus harenae]